MTILARHIHTPTSPHRLVALDDHRLRCLDCAHTLELPAVPSSTSTSKSHPPRDQQCPQHIGEWAHNCRCCRAETLAATDPTPGQTQPTADVAAGIARVRAALHRQEQP